jgi:surface polysaccharide O-acyltransferase-like enzyme
MQRAIGLDNLRLLAGAAVVLLHVSGFAFRAFDGSFTALWWAGNAVNSSTRWTVPVFVMISGALLLPRRDEPAAEFYRRRASRLLLPLLFWPPFYAALDLFWQGRAIGVRRVLRIAFVDATPYYHLWFLYMIVGLYALTPLLRRVLRWIPAGVLAVVAWLPFLVVDAGRWRGWLAFVPYLGYYLLGAALVSRRREMGPRAAAALALVAIAVTIVGTRLLVGRYGMDAHARWLQDNLGPVTLAASVGLFEWARSVWTNPWAGARQEAAVAAVFGVYLVHPLVIDVLWRAGFTVEPGGPWWSVPVVSLAALTVSAGTVLALRGIPGVRRLV